jgi:hypothetical protein
VRADGTVIAGGEGNPAAAHALDFQLILAGKALMRFAGCRIVAARGEAPLDLLAKEEIVDVHRESPWGLEARI